MALFSALDHFQIRKSPIQYPHRRDLFNICHVTFNKNVKAVISDCK